MTNDTLTKREQFAGMAMQGLIVAQPEEVNEHWEKELPAAIAAMAVEHADALIAALGCPDALVADALRKADDFALLFHRYERGDDDIVTLGEVTDAMFALQNALGPLGHLYSRKK